MMAGMTSSKPYLIDAFYHWIVDNHLTPYLLVDTDYPGIDVPVDYASNGRIVLDIAPDACQGLIIEKDRIIFTARFSGQTRQIFIAPGAVLAIYAKENGRGMEFGEEYNEPPPAPSSPNGSSRRKPLLKVVK